MSNLKRKLCSWIDPDKFAKYFTEIYGEQGLIWLDGDGSHLGRWVTIGVDPIKQVCCRQLSEKDTGADPFQALNKLRKGHWTGWLSYEAGAWVEPSNPWKNNYSMATLWIACHDPVFKFDLIKHELWIEGIDETRFKSFLQRVDEISETTNVPNQDLHESRISIAFDSWKWLTTNEEFCKKVNKVKELIKEGDIFQANISACCTTNISEDVSPLNIFLRLRKSCPAPFGGIIIGSGSAKGQAIISTSPERFIKVLPTGEIEARPIKGTRPRDKNPYKDAEIAADLVSSPKDRAENIMIVDLLRNDLGRVAKPGSIYVEQLLALESYEHVHHLTSVIKGVLRTNKTWIDLLKACWPAGSITGAPKLRACQRINELEPTARGPYCGSLIHLDWNGTFDSNILIRSLILQKSRLIAHAGCGIVADSDAQREADELNWKLLPILKALE